MATLDLRPLSLGEILDRTFTLYRSHFLLFFGIAAIPQVLVLALQLGQLVRGSNAVTPGTPGAPPIIRPGLAGASIVVGLVTVIVVLLAYLLSQGATVSAVSELYLGRTPAIGESFRKVRSDLGILFGVAVLNGLVVAVGFILLVIPGIYLTCRLMTAVPAAVLENLGPRSSLERSMALTKDSAGRAFAIFLLYIALLMAFAFLIQVPAAIGLVAVRGNPAMFRLMQALMNVTNALGTTLITPVFTISASVFYFDLRVRKEAFDLQMMMNPGGSIAPATSAGSLLG
jgi:hypothetical protein